MTQRQNTRHTRDRQYTLRPEEQNCAKLIVVYYYKSPLGRIPDCMNKPFQYSAGAYMLSYSKGSEIPVYCQVCPEPFHSYHKKGMFPRLQGTIKLKAVSRLLGRTPCLQARSARGAESPVCRHISATLLWLH